LVGDSMKRPGLDAPVISQMNHFTAEIYSLVKHLSRKVFIT